MEQTHPVTKLPSELVVEGFQPSDQTESTLIETQRIFTGSVFDEPYYENLSYEYIDFIYYYILQKMYNIMLKEIYKHLHNQSLENLNIIKIYKKLFYSFVPTEIINIKTETQTIEQWESLFKYVDIEMLYFIDIHINYYTDFENDEYPEHPTHPSNSIYIKKLLYKYKTKPAELHSPILERRAATMNTHSGSNDENKKKEYMKKIKNRIVMDIYKLLSLDFEENQEKASELPSHIYSIFKRLPPNNIPFLNYVTKKKTNSFFLESITILNIENWLG